MVISLTVKTQTHLEANCDTQIQLSYYWSNENLLNKILGNADKDNRIWAYLLNPDPELPEIQGIMARK